MTTTRTRIVKMKKHAQRLPTWDQACPRSYMRFVLCFPFDDSKTEDAVEYIRICMQRLAEKRPEFAGRLRLRNRPQRNTVYLVTAPEDHIPIEVFDRDDNKIGFTYEELRQQGFPASAFTDERFQPADALTPEDPDVDVMRVRAFFIEGGLLLGLFLYHSVADGDGFRMVLEELSAITRGEQRRKEMMPTQLSLDVEPPSFKFQEYMRQTSALEVIRDVLPGFKAAPMFNHHVNYTAPLPRSVSVDSSPKTGKLFVFRNDKLRTLKELLDGPSQIICLAALTWAHVAAARLRATGLVDSAGNIVPGSDIPDGRFMMPVGWRKRALRDCTKDYFGNAFTYVTTHVPVSRLVAASTSHSALKTVVADIQNSINKVDDEQIRRQNAVFSVLSDLTSVSAAHDETAPQDFFFNSWRWFGADTEWEVPGLLSRKPEAVRKGQAAWNQGCALIMPGSAESGMLEILITVPKRSMGELCGDEAWMGVVDQVFG